MRTGCLFFLNLTSDVPLELTNCPGGSHPLPGSCNFLSFTQLFIFLFLVMNIGKKKKSHLIPLGRHLQYGCRLKVRDKSGENCLLQQEFGVCQLLRNYLTSMGWFLPQTGSPLVAQGEQDIVGWLLHAHCADLPRRHRRRCDSTRVRGKSSQSGIIKHFSLRRWIKQSQSG